jgi:hypothetical protein
VPNEKLGNFGCPFNIQKEVKTMKDISKLVFGDGIFSALPSAHARSDNETLRHAKT